MRYSVSWLLDAGMPNVLDVSFRFILIEEIKNGISIVSEDDYVIWP